jgi:hypothetical protein
MRLERNEAREVLTWLAQPNAARPAWLADDSRSDALQDFLEAHRLTGRFLERAAVALEQTCSIAALAASHQSTVDRIRTAIANLAHASGSDSADPVVLMKGPTAHVLTGNPAHLRPGRDLDVWSADPNGLARRLLANGGLTASPLVAQHEIASIDLKGMKIDVHRFIPFARYAGLDRPPSLRELVTMGAQVSERCTVGALDMGTLLEAGTVSGSLPPPLCVFGATASTLIACIALTTDLAWEPWAPKSTRLVALFEIHEMCCHPDFDPELFKTLITAAGLETNVLMCARALEAYFPPSPLHAFSDGRPELVQKLSNAIYGPWVARNIDEVFLGGPGSSYDSLDQVLTTVPRGEAHMLTLSDRNTIRWGETWDEHPKIQSRVATDANCVVLKVECEPRHLQNIMLFFENGLHCDLVLGGDREPQVWAAPGTRHSHRIEEHSVRLAVDCGAAPGHHVRGLAVVGGRATQGGVWSRVAPIVTVG